MDGTFTDIFGRMDTGWQDRQGTTVVLEGKGFEWGRDWRIWCANLKQANRYRGVVVEVFPASGVRLNVADNLGRFSIFLPHLFHCRNRYLRNLLNDISSERTIL